MKLLEAITGQQNNYIIAGKKKQIKRWAQHLFNCMDRMSISCYWQLQIRTSRDASITV